jgi:hypothetical protein
VGRDNLPNAATEWLLILVHICDVRESGGGLQSLQAKWTVKKSVALVHEWPIPTKRPPLVGEVSANFCVWRVSHGQCKGSPRPVSRPELLLFLASSSSIVL